MATSTIDWAKYPSTTAWCQWTSTSTSSGTTDMECFRWNDPSGTSTITETTSATDIAWVNWQTFPENYAIRRIEPDVWMNEADRFITPEAQAERAERRRREERQWEEIRQKQAEAESRSLALLRDHLDEAQRAELQRTERYFTVVCQSGVRYRVRNTGTVANIEVVDDEGKVLRRLCAHPERVPQGDVMLAQKLALELDEPAFLRLANVS